MNIYQIKTINGGFKGLEVSFTEERVEANKRRFTDDITKEKNDPIHLALDKPIKALRRHLLEICGIIGGHTDQTEVDYAIAETEITAIRMTKTLFIIEGEKEWMNNKRFKLKTPKIEFKDNYISFDEIVALLAEIRKEAEIYMRGTAVVTDEEAVVRYITSGKDKSIDNEEYEKMTDEEKLQFHKKIIEDKFGGIVMVQDDIQDIDHEEVKEIAEVEEQEIDLNEQM